ncbi:polygalacturonase [Pestalotiopsis sp. NC0098]|nr:polygalacturonase [Pestalotiopsis sp. NC0098]
MTIMHSSNVLMEDIYVNSTSHSGNPARNTDGLDTLFSDNITLRRWLVDNGDDGISLKANSTNVVLEDSILRRGQGFALGSIGQYKGAFETIENVTVRNVSMINTNFAVNVKTWTGDQVNYPPNGGGGGLGYIKNVTIQDITLTEVRSFAVNIGQCTAFDGASDKDCDSSLFHIGNITFDNFTGDLAGKYVGNMQCSEDAGGCDGIEFGDIDLTKTSADTAVDDYKCSNVVDPIGFEC